MGPCAVFSGTLVMGSRSAKGPPVTTRAVQGARRRHRKNRPAWSSGKLLRHRQAMRTGVEIQLEAAVHFELAVDGGQVIAQSVLADMELFSNHLVARALLPQEHRYDVPLFRRQRGDLCSFG